MVNGVSTTDSTAVTNSYSSTETTGDVAAALGKDDFLKLLVTQLKYQNPLEPLKDNEFIAQMAQFSSLEQMKNLNDTISDSYSMMMKGDAVGLLGKKVTILDEETQEQVSLLIDRVKFVEDSPVFYSGDSEISPSEILDIRT